MKKETRKMTKEQEAEIWELVADGHEDAIIAYGRERYDDGVTIGDKTSTIFAVGAAFIIGISLGIIFSP